MKNPLTNPVAPRLDEGALEERSLAQLEMHDEIDLENLLLTGVATGDATGGRFGHIRFQNARLTAVAWRRAQFEDLTLETCDLAGADFRESYFSRVEITECRAVGLQAPECNWRDVVCREGNWSMAQFRYSRFERVRFEDLDLREADFQNADLRGAVFRNCDLRDAEFSFAFLQGADFRTCNTENVRIDAGALQGLIVSPLQAAQFAGVLGLQVRWTEEDLK